MSDHFQPAPLQMSLFPGESQVQAEALVALRDLDVGRARRLLDRVRRQNPRLVNLGVIDEALQLLESFPMSGPPRPDALAEVVLAVRDRYLDGGLSRAAAEFLDETIARYWRRRGHGLPFLDAGERVHRGVLDLVLEQPATARRHLSASLEGEYGRRADLWSYLGDASLLLERTDDAEACYVRALLLSAAAVDLMRIRLEGLAQLYRELRRTHPEDSARELLLVDAWLTGLLDIPPDNPWLARWTPHLTERARAGRGSAADRRYRRFAWLLYLDRSRPHGCADMAQREEMAELDEDLFARYMRECRRREPGR